jgi:hypothetical protein
MIPTYVRREAAASQGLSPVYPTFEPLNPNQPAERWAIDVFAVLNWVRRLTRSPL